MANIKREAFGQRVSIGCFYDARADSFLADSLLGQDVNPADLATHTPMQTAETFIIKEDRLREKFKTLGLTRDVGASLLAGLIVPQGSSAYLSEPAQTTPGVHCAVGYTITTAQEELNFGAFFTNPILRECINMDALSGSGATHIVTGVTWGVRAIVSAFQIAITDGERSMAEKEMEAAVEAFFNPRASVGGPSNPSNGAGKRSTAKYFGDVEPGAQPGPMAFTEALEHLGYLPDHLQSVGGTGLPLVYTLFPISGLVFLGTGIPNSPQPSQLSPEGYDKVINLLDELALALPSFVAYLDSLKQLKSIVPPQHFTDVEDRLSRVLNAQSHFKNHFPRLLEAVRSGASTSQVVLDMIDSQFTPDLAPTTLLDLAVVYKPKLDFISSAVQCGAEYIGEGFVGLQDAIAKSSHQTRTVYVFYFGTAAMDDDDDAWKASNDVLSDVLSQNPKPPVLLVDCDIGGPELRRARIAVFVDGVEKAEDLAAQRQEIAGMQLIRYEEGALEKTDTLPAHRSSVQLYCPSPGCDSQDVGTWSCYRCLEEVEFGSRDGFFYCDCGRAQFDRVGFNCQKMTHPPGEFSRFERRRLRQLLLSLPPPREVNILILGETGVGKSTFVNAFINYLTFSSLDEALKADTLHWIIPCSFTHQQHDKHERLVSQNITVGKDDDEHDGSTGQSATQQATVYPLYFKDTLIRLIDTPGIGDTRGPDQDKNNMANILSVLRNYANLHGIIILLKPNNARLGVMFRFCVKELLTHLHRSAAENMVFGFTNTRGSNFTPGDTFVPLETLLSAYNDVIPGLYRYNVYCFDSESFRYLAARKRNVDMGNIDDYRRSWDHSSMEANRLIKHFRQLDPHNTQRTLSLNETRHLILKLTAPMQQISAAIVDTIAKNEKQIRELRDTEIHGDELKTKLQIHKTSVSGRQLTKPKTVCAHTNCVDVVFDDTKGEEVKLRKNLCHNPCCLTNVPVGRVGTPELEQCYAFDGATCKVCGHHWKDHEHIMVEYSTVNTTTVDEAVQRELEETGDIATAKKKTILNLRKQIDELKSEHEIIQKAAARFSVYLKSNSITHYNDATIEYYEHLIKDEKTKASRAGRSTARLDQLKKDRDTYQKFVDAMQNGKKGHNNLRPLDEAGVANVVQSLYHLLHYGADLKRLAQVVGRAYEANFRERPYRISRNQHWRENNDAVGHSDPPSSLWGQVTSAARVAVSSMGMRPTSYQPTGYRSMIGDLEQWTSSRRNGGKAPSLSSPRLSNMSPESSFKSQSGFTSQNPWASSLTSQNLDRSSDTPSPAPSSRPTAIHGKALDWQPKKKEETRPAPSPFEDLDDDDFWPVPKSDDKPKVPVQSISGAWDAGEGTSSGKSGSGPLTTSQSPGASFTSPPPYTEISQNIIDANRFEMGSFGTNQPQMVNGVQIVQKKGMWFKLRNKFNKKRE